MNHRRIESVSTPFFVTNFPPEADVKTLWEACDKVGKVVDVYVARKLSKLEIWMGSYHLFASVARFSRDVSNKGVSNKKEKVASHNSVEQVKKLNVHDVAHSSSYANVLKGQGVVKTNKGLVPECILQGQEIDNPLSLTISIFGKLRDIRSIPMLCILLKEEEDGDAPLAVKRVCIKTGKPFLIQDMIKVVAQGVEYGVVVREISNWEPNIIEEGEIGSDIPDVSGGEEEDACFDDDVNDFIDVENGDKVDEGQENSFSMDNTPINGVRGAGFVDRKGRFFQTNNKEKVMEMWMGVFSAKRCCHERCR
ncbi:unnamed protein product [Lactuca virosa]|uniref:RRM domain-containing protein n=1 Tax=Lactuca virosa TaxID=75947 RepID=A0AAU9NYM2_9ASTR|nr:unnamed protein product [Lactuca virosa]